MKAVELEGGLVCASTGSSETGNEDRFGGGVFFGA